MIGGNALLFDRYSVSEFESTGIHFRLLAGLDLFGDLDLETERRLLEGDFECLFDLDFELRRRDGDFFLAEGLRGIGDRKR